MNQQKSLHMCFGIQNKACGIGPIASFASGQITKPHARSDLVGNDYTTNNESYAKAWPPAREFEGKHRHDRRPQSGDEPYKHVV